MPLSNAAYTPSQIVSQIACGNDVFSHTPDYTLVGGSNSHTGSIEHLLLKEDLPPTKEGEEIPRLPDVLGVGITYTCSISRKARWGVAVIAPPDE
jgi:hypothetical protein